MLPRATTRHSAFPKGEHVAFRYGLALNPDKSQLETLHSAQSSHAVYLILDINSLRQRGQPRRWPLFNEHISQSNANCMLIPRSFNRFSPPRNLIFSRSPNFVTMTRSMFVSVRFIQRAQLFSWCGRHRWSSWHQEKQIASNG